jgi:hypothetical protein
MELGVCHHLPAAAAEDTAAAWFVSRHLDVLWFFSGNERMRWPGRLEVGIECRERRRSSARPRCPRATAADGMIMDSTFGISGMRIEL